MAKVESFYGTVLAREGSSIAISSWSCLIPLSLASNCIPSGFVEHGWVLQLSLLIVLRSVGDIEGSLQF